MATLSGEAGLHLIREALEGVIEPTKASAVLFDALERDGAERLPESVDALLAFVRGPLFLVTEGRVGPALAREVVQRIEGTFDRANQGLPLRDGLGSSTLELPIGGGPVRVVVVSRSSQLAVRLRAALGGMQIKVATAPTPEEAQSTANEVGPEVIVIDAMDPVEDAEGLLRFLAGTPETTTRILWGEEQVYGQRLHEDAAAAGVRLTPVERREGVEPLLDLIRSRSA